MVSVRLSVELEARLDRLARKTGRPRSHFVREALRAYLSDYEDHQIADRRMASYSADKTIPLDELARMLRESG